MAMPLVMVAESSFRHAKLPSRSPAVQLLIRILLKRFDA